MASLPEGERLSTIDIDQTLPENLRLMKARQGLFKVAVRWQIAQLLIVVAIPLIGAVLAVQCPDYKGPLGALSVMITITDVLFLDRQYRRAIKTAAKGSEHFDSAVLKLGWNTLSAGRRLQPEDVSGAADLWERAWFKGEIKDWYPAAVRFAPLHVARVICQRANVSYDSALRRRYGSLLLIVVVALAAGIVGVALWNSATLADTVLTGMVPAAPLVIWAFREFFRQRDAAEANDIIQQESETLLARVIGKECDAESCTAESAQLQGALFNRRATNPLLLPGVYDLQRFVMEKRMNEGAEHWVKTAGFWPSDC
jgi:hypothetical protein